jgi:hypothetical protein
MTIPTEILSKAREIYEGSWPDPVAAIAEALMQAREAAAINPRTMSPEALEAHVKELQSIINENRERDSL